MSNKSPEELIGLHESFLACAPADRPLLGAWLGGYFPAAQFARGVAGWREGQVLSPGDVRLEPFAADYDRLFQIHRDVADDFFYVGSAYWGLPWLEAILGCPVVAGRESCWAEPCLGEDEQLPAAADLHDNSWFKCLADFTRELVELSAGQFPVCPPLLRGPGDAAAAMRGGMVLVMDCIDRPEAARQLFAHCAGVRLEVVRRLAEIIPPWRGTHAVGGYPSKLWSRQTIAYNQEDFAALLSPEMFRDLLLPLERQMCAAAEVNFIHLHSGSLYPVDMLLEDDSYDVLEVNLDRAGPGPSLAGLLPTFQRIQAARRPLLLWGEISPADWQLLRRELNPAGLSIQPLISRPEEMDMFRR
jgi:hypothetical protein